MKHDDYQSAVEECQRLARKHRGETIEVLQITTSLLHKTDEEIKAEENRYLAVQNERLKERLDEADKRNGRLERENEALMRDATSWRDFMRHF